MSINIFLFFVFVFSNVFSVSALAQELKSSNFNDANPVPTVEGGFSSSSNFQMYSGSGQVVIGESSSTNFGYRAGFFYFPVVTTPVVAATPANAQVSLSWTAASANLGWSISGYQLGVGLASNGPFTYSSVGNVLSAIKTGLTNGSAYYFVVRVLDFYNNPIATSSPVASTPVAPVVPPSPGGGGGGGGGPVPSSITSVTLSGRAYPLSKVTVLQDGQVVITTIAGPDANWSVTMTNLSGGSYNFAVYSEDSKGRRSNLFTFPLTLTTGSATTVSGIFITPNIDVDKSEVKRGENIAIFGQSIPSANIVISVNSVPEYFLQTKTDAQGAYLYTFDTSPLDYGSHDAKSKVAIAAEISQYSRLVGFTVTTTKSVVKTTPKCASRADLNGDCKVNLVDFSIAAYWYRRTLSPAFAIIEKDQLNGGGKINLTDFSIMAYYWTG